MDEFTRGAIAVGLKHLFSKSYFDICLFDKIANITCSRPSAEIRKPLGVLHCVDYSEMPPELRKELYRKVVEALGSPDIPDVRITDEGVDVVEPPKCSWIKRLSGGGK